ncbi:hypothetical protein [Candidatus Nitrosocosmicus sp. T]
MIDILIVASSAMLGIICALFVFQIIKIRRESRLKILGNVKYELSSLYFEKSVALEALNKINQHFEEKRIDEYERDRLSHKYINLLDEYDKRAFQLNPILEVQEIYEYRNQLNSILSDYVKKIDTKLASLGLGNNESNFKDNDKNYLNAFSKPKQTNSILNKIKTMKFSNKRSKESLSQVDNDNQGESEFGINEGLKETEGRSINDINKDYTEINQDGTRTSTPLDLKQSTIGNIDLNEIDKIQRDILKTLKRLGDS